MSNNIDLSKFSKEKALYVVATPIGNLDDITFRALKAIKNADLLLCEDTRVTKKLLNHYGISQRLESYNDHNGDAKIPKLLEMLHDGASVAIVSDAGTPLISDPGYRLVHECQNAGIKVIPIPGASSVMAALCAAGVPTDSFTFHGFWDSKKLAEFKSGAKVLVFFESAKRLNKTFAKIAHEFGGTTPITVARELTKLFEEFRKGSAVELSVHYDQHPAKGEVVFIMQREEVVIGEAEIITVLKAELKNAKLKDASAIVAEKFNLSKKAVYEIGLNLKK
jgi:16S rRNA (cytidine1402-2'-O)-methyltransferase